MPFGPEEWIVSKGSRSLLLGTGIALGAAVLAAATAQAQTHQPQQQQQSPQDQQPSQAQPQLKQGQPQFQESQPQDFDQLWQMQKQQARARIAGAVQQLQTACGDELHNFCSTVTPGEGRLLLCMQAHEDKISRQCELALLETSRNIGKIVRHIETFAQACWPDIQAHCSGTGGSVTQCVMDNRGSLSPVCRAIVAAMLPRPGAAHGQGQQKGQQQGQAPQGQGPSMVGLSIYSTDGTMLGEVTGVKRRPDGSLEAIEADLGNPLGLGATSVLISPSDLRWKGDGVELQMAAEQVRAILQGHRR
jgi:Golgi apparatus protein 1